MIKGILVVILVVVIAVAAFLFQGWLVMLALGALGHVFGVARLCVGYGPSLIVTLALSVLGGLLKSSYS